MIKKIDRRLDASDNDSVNSHDLEGSTLKSCHTVEEVASNSAIGEAASNKHQGDSARLQHEHPQKVVTQRSTKIIDIASPKADQRMDSWPSDGANLFYQNFDLESQAQEAWWNWQVSMENAIFYASQYCMIQSAISAKAQAFAGDNESQLCTVMQRPHESDEEPPPESAASFPPVIADVASLCAQVDAAAPSKDNEVFHAAASNCSSTMDTEAFAAFAPKKTAGGPSVRDKFCNGMEKGCFQAAQGKQCAMVECAYCHCNYHEERRSQWKVVRRYKKGPNAKVPLMCNWYKEARCRLGKNCCFAHENPTETLI